MGTFGDIVERLRNWRGRRKPEIPPFEVSPADGAIGLPQPDGMIARPNRSDPRFLEFTSLDATETVRPPGRSSGRTPPLLGRVAFVSLFLGRDGRRWKDIEIARTLAALIRTGEWIESEARRWNAAVNIEVASVYFNAVDPESEGPVALGMVSEEFQQELMDSDAEVRLVASASRAAAEIGFHDVGDLALQVAGRLQADSVIWFVHPRSVGRSFVVPEKDTGMRGVSMAICYAQEDDLPGPLVGSPYADPSTFAHEALHLFGASDKYGVSLTEFPPGTVTEFDIMRLDFETLSRLRIDPATASEIGWN